jgi:hypothetical protein
MPRPNGPELIESFVAPVMEAGKRQVVVLKIPAGLNFSVPKPEATIETFCVRRKAKVVDLKDIGHLSGPESSGPVLTISLFELEPPVPSA